MADAMKPDATKNVAQAKKTDLDKELEKLGLIKSQATEIASALKNLDKRAQMDEILKGTKIGGVNAFERAYMDNLKSDAAYLDFERVDKDKVLSPSEQKKYEEMQQKVAVMKDALKAFGIERVTYDELAKQGYKASQFDNQKSGFHADLFRNGDSTYTLAFRGTNDLLKDGWTDLANALGLKTKQYEEAAKLAVALRDNDTFKRGLSFTGHSLGGGLAAMAAARTNLSANTFNAASIHPDVVKALDGKMDGLSNRVMAYSLQGDIVNALQDSHIVDAAGLALRPDKTLKNLFTGNVNGIVDSVPEASGQRIYMKGYLDSPLTSWLGRAVAPIGLHSNGTVLNSFYRQFQQLQQPAAASGGR